MHIETSELWLAGALVLLLIIASVTDWQRREIDNWLNATVALAAPLFWLAAGLDPWPGMAIQFATGVGVFALFAVFFAINAMGGGDFKLLVALGLWFPPLTMLHLILIMSIMGGFLTVFMLIRQKRLNLEGKPEIPYGIAITFAGLWVIYERYINHFPSLIAV